MIKHAFRAALATTILLSSQAHAADAPTLPALPADPPALTVPEPGSVALAGVAVLGMLAARRRRQQRVKAEASQD